MNLLGALCGLGDLIAQTAIDKKSFDAVEWSRVGRFAFIGATLIVRDLLIHLRCLGFQYVLRQYLVIA